MREEILLSGDNWGLNRFKPGEGEKEGVYEPDFYPAPCPVNVPWTPYNTFPYGFGWLRANVPGDVHSTLIRAKVIPDPYFGLNNEKCRWVSDYEWWYRKAFYVPEEWKKKGKVIRLIFEGVDYKADFWANGNYLGSHEGMFSPVVFDITEIAKGPNRPVYHPWVSLAVCISPPPKNRKEIGGRKCNLGYAIDYAPSLLTMGIWKDVKAFVSGEVYVEDIFIATKLREKKAVIGLQIECVNSGKKRKEVRYEIRITGKNFTSGTYEKVLKKKVKVGRQIIKTDIEIPGPKLWWPWDRGEQNLYKMEIKVFEGKEEQDCIEKIFGIREIKMLRNPESPKDSFPFTFTINGKKEYIRGANWTNIDLLPENLKEDRYKRILTMVKGANINMLRIHGWHLIEKEEFYNLCDEMGILIWQEFGFCNLEYPQTKKFLGKVNKECIESVKLIRNHPSLTVWCGGNEYRYEDNKKLIDTLGAICTKYDPTCWFIPVSPFKGGDNHNWNIWHGLSPIMDYSKDTSLFTSEFGIQAVPNIESLKKFIPENELWPPGPSWEYHFAELYKINYYAHYAKYGDYVKGKKTEEIFDNIEDFIKNNQKAQAEVLKFGIEHYRCRKYRNSGSMFFAFNEPWPSIICSVVDWYLKPKKAYYTVRDAYAPILISLQHQKKEWKKGEEFKGEIWIVNDYYQSFENCLVKVKIVDGENNLLKEMAINVNKIEKDSTKNIHSLGWSISGDCSDKFQVLVNLQNSEELTIASNKYIFTIK